MGGVMVDVQGKLAGAGDVVEVGMIVRSAARRLADAQGATFVLRDGPDCFYADEDAISPLWKGQRFPLEHCISGWAMLNRSTAVVPDIMVDPRIPLDAYRPTFVRSLLVVPVGGPEPVAAIGAYWSERQVPDPGVVRLLEDLAEQTARAIDRVGLDDAPWAPTFRRSVPHPVEAR
jgi:GAF domain-containing protein